MITLEKKFITLFFLLSLISLTSAGDSNPKNIKDAYSPIYNQDESPQWNNYSDSVLTVLGRWAWGSCVAVDADSNFAYIGNGPTFHVLDISNPSSPVILGEYLTEGYLYDIELRDNIALVCTGGGFLILDISNPTSPQKISEISISGVAISFALVDSFAYVTTFTGTMWLVDISDVSNPYLRNVTGAGGQLASCVEAKDKYVYIGNPEWPPMVIVDATNPDSLSRVDFEVGGWGLTAYVKDTLLFVGVRGYDGKRYLKIFDISNASSPQFLSELQMQSSIEGITVSQDGLTAYVVTQSKGIYSVDLTNLAQPVILDRFERVLPVDIGNAGIALYQSTLLSAYYNGLLMLDVSQPDSLKLRSFFPTGGDALEMDSKDSLVFVACGLSGMWILDCSNPEKVINVGNVITGGLTVNVVVDDTIAYIYNWKQDSETDSTIGLWIIDINNPYQPKLLTHYIGSVGSSPPHSMIKSNNFIFITQFSDVSNDTIMEIIDVSNVLNPQSISVLTGKYHPHNLTVKDSALYLATSDGGLRIIDISDIFNPHEVNAFEDSSFLVGIETKGNLAFADRIDTLFVLDISDPFNPSIIGKMGRNYGGFATIHLEIDKDYLYWAEGALGVVDISDSTTPKELTKFVTPAYSGYDVKASRDIILFSDRSVGVWLLRNKLLTSIEDEKPYVNSPERFQLLQNYPNPFNPTTTIEFTLPIKEKILIEVFDLLGQRVTTLLDKDVRPGLHRIVFDGTNLPSGVYFYRMKTPEFSLTKKMLLLK